MAIFGFLSRRAEPSQSVVQAPRQTRTKERQEPQLFGPAVRNVRKADSFAGASYPSWMAAGLGALPSATGLPVTPFTSLQASAVFSCIRCLSEDWAKLPIEFRRRRPSGRGWEEFPQHPVAQVLRSPNRWQTPFQFWSFASTCLNLRGNAYIVIVRGTGGLVRSLVPVPPDRVSVLLSPKGWLFYHISHPLLGEGLVLHQDDVIHLRGFSLDGYMGLSPIMACPEAIGLALATQRHGATLFRQGAQITGVLKVAKSLSPEAAQRLAQSWREVYGGVDNAGRTAVIEEGIEYDKIGMTAEESQFLEVRQHQDIEICGMFRVPPSKIGREEKSTLNNIENKNQEYIDNALVPPIRQAEEILEEKLLFKDERDTLKIRWNFDELLRGDMKSRVDAGVQAVNSGLKSANEWRAQEGLNPYEGGDEFRVPLNTGAASDAPPPDSPERVTAPSLSDSR